MSRYSPASFINWKIYNKVSELKKKVLRKQAIARYRLSKHPSFQVNWNLFIKSNALKRRALLLSALYRSLHQRRQYINTIQPVDMLPDSSDWNSVLKLYNYLAGHQDFSIQSGKK